MRWVSLIENIENLKSKMPFDLKQFDFEHLNKFLHKAVKGKDHLLVDAIFTRMVRAKRWGMVSEEQYQSLFQLENS